MYDSRRLCRPTCKTCSSIGPTSGCAEESVVSSGGDKDEGGSSVDDGVSGAGEHHGTEGNGGDGDTPELVVG